MNGLSGLENAFTYTLLGDSELIEGALLSMILIS